MRQYGRFARLLVVALLGLGTVTSCHDDGNSRSDAAPTMTEPIDPLLGQAPPPSRLRISSPAFDDRGTIPEEYTCTGTNVSPQLDLSRVPETAKSLALVVDDPDAPDPAAPTKDFVHWILFDLALTTTALPRALASLPPPGKVGKNDWGKTSYGGPCPPKGRHRYYFRLYALDTTLNLESPNLDELRAAATDHIIATTALMGTVQAK